MSSNESEEIEINLRRREADQSGSLEPDLESSRAEDTRSTVEMRAEDASLTSDDDNFERFQEELETLLDPPAASAVGANSRTASRPMTRSLLQRLLERVNELESKVEQSASEKVPGPASSVASYPDIKNEFHRLEHADHRSLSRNLILIDRARRQ